MKQALLILSLIVFFGSSCNSPKKLVKTAEPLPPGVRFIENEYLSDIIEVAKKEEKAVFIDFVADWCLPCKIMDEEVYSDNSVGEYFNQNFINFKVDIDQEKGANIAAIYQVHALPTMIFVDTIGRTLQRVEGAVFHEELMAYAKGAKVKFESIE